mmetsp:Transcript_63366/g.151206  ORF Transcript_63366/g.151206 Transcript_63366/m.151206 type:complete len:903 (+) Transcript_63366:141-2849(+)
MRGPRSVSGSLSNSNSGSERVRHSNSPCAEDLHLRLKHTLSEISAGGVLPQAVNPHLASSPFPLHGVGVTTPPLSAPRTLPLIRASSDQCYHHNDAHLATPTAKRRDARLRLQLEAQAEVVRAVEAFSSGLQDFKSKLHSDRRESVKVQEKLLEQLQRLEHSICGESDRNGLVANAIEEVTKQVKGVANALSDATPAVPPQPRPLNPWCPRYKSYDGHDGLRRELPEVQVALKIYHIGCVDTALMTFDTDFTCHLDWRDRNLAGLTVEDLRELDWTKFFNPVLSIDNGKGDSGWLEGADTVPRLYCNYPEESSSFPVTPRGVRDDEAFTKGPWLRKTMRFRGPLTLAAADLRCFPFDVLVLPIRLKAVRCRNLKLGNTLDGASHRDRVHLVDDGRMTRDEEYRDAEPRLRGKGHHITRSADRAMLEFDICGVSGGLPSDELRTDMYEVKVVVRRPLLSNHCWDVITMNLLVLLAAASFWDSSAPELSSRLGITLTVVLTLAAFTSARPAAIQKAPYVTFHDWCEQVSLLLVILIAVQNVVAVTLCGGEHEEAPSHMTEIFERHSSSCEFSWCMSRAIDCHALLVLLIFWALLFLYSIIWVSRTRRNAVQGAYMELQAGRSSRCLSESSGSSKEGGCLLPRWLRSLARPSRCVKSLLSHWTWPSEAVASGTSVPRARDLDVAADAQDGLEEEQEGEDSDPQLMAPPGGLAVSHLEELRSEGGSSTASPPGVIGSPDVTPEPRSPAAREGSELWAVTPQSSLAGSIGSSRSDCLRKVVSFDPHSKRRSDEDVTARAPGSARVHRASTTSSSEVRDVLEKTIRHEDDMQSFLGHHAMTLPEAGKCARQATRQRSFRSRSPVDIGNMKSAVGGVASSNMRRTQQSSPGSLPMGLAYQPLSEASSAG